MMRQAMETNTKLTIDDCFLIFLYTDNIIYQRLNGFHREIPEILDSMSLQEKATTSRLSQRLREALEKMDDVS